MWAPGENFQFIWVKTPSALWPYRNGRNKNESFYDVRTLLFANDISFFYGQREPWKSSLRLGAFDKKSSGASIKSFPTKTTYPRLFCSRLLKRPAILLYAHQWNDQLECAHITGTAIWRAVVLELFKPPAVMRCDGKRSNSDKNYYFNRDKK